MLYCLPRRFNILHAQSVRGPCLALIFWGSKLTYLERKKANEAFGSPKTFTLCLHGPINFGKRWSSCWSWFGRGIGQSWGFWIYLKELRVLWRPWRDLHWHPIMCSEVQIWRCHKSAVGWLWTSVGRIKSTCQPLNAPACETWDLKALLKLLGGMNAQQQTKVFYVLRDGFTIWNSIFRAYNLEWISSL